MGASILISGFWVTEIRWGVSGSGGEPALLQLSGKSHGHRINIPRRSRGFFIDGQSPMILATRHVTLVRPDIRVLSLSATRKRVFRSFPLSVVLPPYLLPTDDGCTPQSFLHFSLLCLRSTHGTRTPCSDTCISIPGTFRRSLDCSSL